MAHCFVSELTHDSESSRENYLRDLPDKILTDLHAEMREVMQLRAERLPNAKNVKHANLDRTLAYKSPHVTYGYGWDTKGKFVRSYKPQDWIIEKKLKNTNSMTGKNFKKKNFLRLHDRHKTRANNSAQQHCMLYAKIFAIERITRMSIILIKIKFRSPCFDSTITRVFTVKNYYTLPAVLMLKFAGQVFTFEFNNVRDVSGYGVNEREIFRSYRLINYYIALINPIFKKKKKVNPGKILNKSTRRKLALIREKVNKKKKSKSPKRILYKLRQHNHIAFKNSGSDYVILPKPDNRKPYQEFESLTHLWNGSNPAHCTTFYAKQKRITVRGYYYYWTYKWWYYYYRWYLKRNYYYYTVVVRVHGIRCNAA
jgi:hypothetical protein